MLNRTKDGLEIFSNFVIDRNLPKYKKETVANSLTADNSVFIPIGNSFTTINGSGSINVQGAFLTTSFPVVGESQNSEDWADQTYVAKKQKKASFIERLFFKKTHQPKVMTVNEFFKSIKNTPKELKQIDKRIESYHESIKQAEEFGQVALVEQLKNNIEIIKLESQLFAVGLPKVITEDQVVHFYKGSEKGLRLDWIKNFTRVIPSKILETKKRLDLLEVFDNYVILHYDPDTKAFAMTAEEKRKKEDPILFGLISGSKKLYFVADWTDKFCDLTMEDFIDKFGKDAINQNNITTEIKI